MPDNRVPDTLENYTLALNNLEQEKFSMEKELQSPDVVKDQDKYRDLSRKYSKLISKYSLISQIIKLQSNISDSQTLLGSESDQEMIEMLKHDIANSSDQLDNYLATLEDMDENNDPFASGNAIIEIRAGTGGDEAALFAQELFRAYSKFSETLGFVVEIANVSYAPSGGFKEIVFFVEGENAYKAFRYESGVHRVQRVPVTEAAGRIHTSAVSVVVLPEIPEVEVNIKPEEIRIDVYRSSGPGGQSVNTTDSAVRIVHLPTGIIVTCQDQKSQLKNKAKALKILQAKLYDIAQQEAQAELGAIRKDAIQSGDRSAKIRTYNFPQSRVTDHRSKHSWHNLSEIMDGNFSDVSSELNAYFKAKAQPSEQLV